jgi:hypothetical protein
LKAYRVTRVGGDRYAAEWVTEAFRKNGVTYEHSELPRSGLYIDFLPRLNSRTVSLLDHQKLVNQLAGLERKTGRGRDVIDHAPGGHDDVANSVAGACTVANTGLRSGSMSLDEAFSQGRMEAERLRQEARAAGRYY